MTKTNIRKRAISILLILMVMLTMTPMTASAGDGFVEVSTYGQLKDAVNKGEAKIKLMGNIDTTNENGGAGLTSTTNLTFKGGGHVLDLNGHTLKLVTSVKDTHLIAVESQDMTIKDSSSSGSGRIEMEFGENLTNVQYPIYISGMGSLTIDGGTFSSSFNFVNYIECYGSLTINGGTIVSNSKRQVNLIKCEDANLTINGGKLQVPDKNEHGISYGYAVYTENRFGDDRQIVITGGEIDGKVAFTRDDSSVTGTPKYTKLPVKITGGVFKQKVYAYYSKKPSGKITEFSPAVELAGGTFKEVYNENLASSYGLATKLTAGTFEKSANIVTHVSDTAMAGYRACLGNSVILRGNECRTAYDWSPMQGFEVSPTGAYVLFREAVVIPNAWGMKSVKLDGDPIDYFKDWNGTVENLTNATAHTIKFEWNPLAQELKDAGYTYRANFDCYTVGSKTPTTSVPISATATEYSYTISAGIEPSVYSFDLQLNLDKNGSSVGIISNQHIVKLVVNEAPPVLDTFISTVSFRLAKTDIGEPGELSFEAKDVNGENVTIAPAVTWDPANIQEGTNNVSFTIPAPEGYTFVGENGKVTTLKFGGVDVIGYVDSTGALNFSFPLEVPHQHKAASVGYNAKFHWDVCSCGQQIMNTGAKHTMGAWEKSKDIPGGGVEYTRSCTGCGYTETTISYENVKHVTSLVLNMENYPMDGMRPHNFVHQDGDESVADTEIPGQSFYKLTKRDSTIKYPSFSIATGNEKVELSATNPEAYDDPAENPDFAKWTTATGTLWLRPDTEYTDYEKEFRTNHKYKAHLTLDAKEGYAFYEDFKTNQDNFKLYTDMEGITIENYGVRRWYYFSNKPSYDDPNVPEGWGWYTQAPADNSAGASRVQITFVITARNEGDLNITLPELKAGDDLRATWAGFDGTSNIGNDYFVKDCYNTTTQTMQWTGGPSCVIRNNSVTGESVIAQAGQTYTLTIPAVNENVLAHITIKNPEDATTVVENADGTITITYKLPAADDKIVNGATVGVTAPAYGASPNTTATITTGAVYQASAVTWNPADATFGEKAYTATVTLTAETDYTFAGNAVFTINGHAAVVSKNTDGSVTLSYTFPKLTAPHAHDYAGQPWHYLDPGNHYQECKEKDGGFNIKAHTFSAWVNNGNGTQSRYCTICKMADGSAYTETAPYTPSASSGGYVPTVQKPEITIIGSGKADLSADGRTATITANAGHELVSVVLNGKEMGKVEKLTGLKTGDKATITFQAKTDGKAEMDKMIAQKASKLNLMARSAKTAKKNIKVVVKGDLKAITDAGYTVKYKFYRSTKKSAGYKAMLTKKAPTYFNNYGKKGTMYYYKARVMIYDKDGNFVAQTALKQCKYANRLWTK